jgi:hypothetical protein
MRAVDQWAQIEADLDPRWSEIRLAFTPEGAPAPAAAALGPLQPVRVGTEFRFHALRAEGGAERTRNTLRTLDRKRIWGTLGLIEAAGGAASEPEAEGLAPQVSLAELELDSSDHVPRAALLGAPINPTRVPGEIALRFRASGKQGYGVSEPMARRCFERMDADGITGRIRTIYEISDSENAVTQGPVWRIAGRSV